MDRAGAVNQAEMDRRYAHIDLDFRTRSGQLFQDQCKEVEGLVKRLQKGVGLIESDFLSKTDAEGETRDNRCIAELQKCVKRLLGLVAAGTDVSASQRELEELLVGVTDATRQPLARSLRRTPPRQTAKAQRRS
jgi:hypothetical protein